MSVQCTHSPKALIKTLILLPPKREALQLVSQFIYPTNYCVFVELQEVPAMGDSISEGVVQEFVVAPGTAVQADEVIARIETDKVTVDIMA